MAREPSAATVVSSRLTGSSLVAPSAVATLKHAAAWRTLALREMRLRLQSSQCPSTLGQLNRLMGWTEPIAYWKRRTNRLNLEESVRMAQALTVKDMGSFLLELAVMQGMEPVSQGPGLEKVSLARGIRADAKNRRCTKCGDATHLAARCRYKMSVEVKQRIAKAKAKPVYRHYSKAQMAKVNAARWAKKAGHE